MNTHGLICLLISWMERRYAKTNKFYGDEKQHYMPVVSRIVYVKRIFNKYKLVREGLENDKKIEKQNRDRCIDTSHRDTTNEIIRL